MTLIVPKSTADPGRAARPAMVQPAETGAAMARFGEVMAGVGEQLETDRLDRQMKRLQVDMTRDLNDLRLEVAQIGDPDVAEQTWQARAAEIREGYGGAGADGRPRVDPRNEETFNLAFEDLANRHAFQLGSHTLALRQAEREATYAAYAHEASRSGATADEGTRQELLLLGYDQIDGMVAAGVIDAAKGQQLKIELEAGMDSARAVRMIAEDPDAFLIAAENGDFGGLTGEEVSRLRVRAQGEIEARAEAEDREARAFRKAREAEISDVFDGMVAAWGTGRSHADEALLETDEAKAHPRYAEVVGARKLRDRKIRFATMSPPQLRALLNAKDQAPVGGALDLEERQALEAVLAEHQAGYERDPVAYGQAQGLVIPELPEFDAGNPGAFARALELRRGASQDLVDDGYATDLAVFSDADRERLSGVARNTDDPAARVALAKSLAAGLGDDAAGAAASLGDDPTFTWATSLAGIGAPDATLRDIMAGQGKIADKVARVPARDDVLEVFHEATGGEFRDQPALTRGVVNSALALYAEAHPGADPSDFDADDFGLAINRAMGGDGDRGGIQTINPSGARNEFTVPLPPAVSAAALERALDAVSDEILAAGTSARLAAASITGAGPDLGTADASGYNPAITLKQFRLQPLWASGVPADHYLFVRERNGRLEYLRDANGAPFQVRLRDLVREAGQ